MRYKLLGKSGLRVSELCLGTMTFGEDWGWGASWKESCKLFEAFAQAGGNFIDTANIYTNGTSEKYVGEFIASERERFVLATKYTSNMRQGDPNASGNHRKNMMQALDASLKRLKTDYIDLYWIHAWDFMTPVEEVMRALDDLVRAGKVLYVGISDTPAWIVAQANTLAALQGWTSFIGLQVEYSLAQREPERELLPMAHAFGMATLAWSPLAGGILTGKYNQNDQPGDSSEPRRLKSFDAGQQLNDKSLQIAQAVSKIAAEVERTPAQVALNWVRQQQGVVIPIIGARKISHIQDNLGCLDFKLTQEQLEKLNALSQIKLGFPYDFLAGEQVRDIVYGGTFDLIDSRHR